MYQYVQLWRRESVTSATEERYERVY